MNSNKKQPSSPLSKTPVPSLTELLDEVEQRYKGSLADPYDPEVCENSLRDNPKLVKALRRARELFGKKGWFSVTVTEFDAILSKFLLEPVEQLEEKKEDWGIPRAAHTKRLARTD